MKLPFEFNPLLFQLFILIREHTENVFLVGGCVRDMLLKKTPKDFDIVTDAHIDLFIPSLEENGWRINEAGKRFMVLIVSKDGQQFEIANFRKDGTYTDGRRPDSVSIGTIMDDALRRDFTINSLYYNPFTDSIVDPTGKGMKDLEQRLLRFNGNAEARIKEDKLRIMRCYRFSQQLNFRIDTRALKACRIYFPDMCSEIDPERIRNEVEKMAQI